MPPVWGAQCRMVELTGCLCKGLWLCEGWYIGGSSVPVPATFLFGQPSGNDPDGNGKSQILMGDFPTIQVGSCSWSSTSTRTTWTTSSGTAGPNCLPWSVNFITWITWITWIMWIMWIMCQVSSPLARFWPQMLFFWGNEVNLRINLHFWMVYTAHFCYNLGMVYGFGCTALFLSPYPRLVST